MENKVRAKFGDTFVYFASLDDLIKIKRATERTKDLEDLKHLQKIKRIKQLKKKRNDRDGRKETRNKA